jgi:hypothetical protein
VALHHPIISSGTHAGFTSTKSHLFLQKQSSHSCYRQFSEYTEKFFRSKPADINNQHYADLANRLKSIVQDKENIIFVSGHDHNLQYHEDGNLRQISGAGSKVDPSTIVEKQIFLMVAAVLPF